MKLKTFFATHWGQALIFVLGVGFNKGCDFVVEKLKAPDRSFSAITQPCSQGEVLDEDSNRRSWSCVAEFRNHTGASRSLRIGCKTSSGNFVGPVKETGRGGGQTNLQEKICFDENQTAERSCSQTLQGDEFVFVQFEVASYEMPSVDCSSDSF